MLGYAIAAERLIRAFVRIAKAINRDEKARLAEAGVRRVKDLKPADRPRLARPMLVSSGVFVAAAIVLVALIEVGHLFFVALDSLWKGTDPQFWDFGGTPEVYANTVLIGTVAVAIFMAAISAAFPVSNDD